MITKKPGGRDRADTKAWPEIDYPGRSTIDYERGMTDGWRGTPHTPIPSIAYEQGVFWGDALRHFKEGGLSGDMQTV